MMTKPDKVQGEGNYEAAKEYNDATRKFVASGRVEAAKPDPRDPAKKHGGQSIGRTPDAP